MKPPDLPVITPLKFNKEPTVYVPNSAKNDKNLSTAANSVSKASVSSSNVRVFEPPQLDKTLNVKRSSEKMNFKSPKQSKNKDEETVDKKVKLNPESTGSVQSFPREAPPSGGSGLASLFGGTQELKPPSAHKGLASLFGKSPEKSQPDSNEGSILSRFCIS